MAEFKVLITDSYFSSIAPEMEELERVGAEIVSTKCQNEKELIEAGWDADGIMNQHFQISRSAIERFEKCRIISRYGVGYDTIDIPAATAKGIIVTNVPDYCIDEVSTHAIALILTWARSIPRYDKASRNGIWHYEVGGIIQPLRRSILGIVGLGRIGSAVARKAIGLGFEVWAYDPYLIDTDLHVRLVGFEEIVRESDFISLHIPLTEETRHMFSDPEFKMMKKTAYLINTARGPVVDGKALYHALVTGEIAGAALDITEQEPPSPDDPLLKLDNIILTPHSAWYSEASVNRLKRQVARSVADVLSGRLPKYLVNTEVLSKIGWMYGV